MEKRYQVFISSTFEDLQEDTQFYGPWGGGVADVVPSPGSRVWRILYELPAEGLRLLDD